MIRAPRVAARRAFSVSLRDPAKRQCGSTVAMVTEPRWLAHDGVNVRRISRHLPPSSHGPRRLRQRGSDPLRLLSAHRAEQRADPTPCSGAFAATITTGGID